MGKELWVKVICFVLVCFFLLFDVGIMRKACKGYVAFQFSFLFGFSYARTCIYIKICAICEWWNYLTDSMCVYISIVNLKRYTFG